MGVPGQAEFFVAAIRRIPSFSLTGGIAIAVDRGYDCLPNYSVAVTEAGHEWTDCFADRYRQLPRFPSRSRGSHLAPALLPGPPGRRPSTGASQKPIPGTLAPGLCHGYSGRPYPSTKFSATANVKYLSQKPVPMSRGRRMVASTIVGP